MSERDVWDLISEAKDLMTADPEGAAAQLSARVEAGDLDAKYQMAVVLVERDPTTAKRLWEELDAVGFDCAAWQLGCLLFKTDREASEYWLGQAASRADPCASSAALELGTLLVRARRFDEAAPWLDKATAAGVEGAAYWLGYVTEARDPARAIAAYNAAIQEGEIQAHGRLGWLLKQSGDKAGAREQLEVGAALGDPGAMWGLYRLARWWEPTEKLKWLFRAAPGLWRHLWAWGDEQGRFGRRPERRRARLRHRPSD